MSLAFFFPILAGLLISECTRNVDILYFLRLTFYWKKNQTKKPNKTNKQTTFSTLSSKKFCKEGGAMFFPAVTSDKIGGNGHRLKPEMLPLNIRKHFCIVTVTEHGDSVPQEDVWPPSLATCPRGPCLKRGVESDDLQNSLPTLTILWFCRLTHDGNRRFVNVL